MDDQLHGVQLKAGANSRGREDRIHHLRRSVRRLLRDRRHREHVLHHSIPKAALRHRVLRGPHGRLSYQFYREADEFGGEEDWSRGAPADWVRTFAEDAPTRNAAAQLFNSKMAQALETLHGNHPGTVMVFLEIYDLMIERPSNYGNFTAKHPLISFSLHLACFYFIVTEEVMSGLN